MQDGVIVVFYLLRNTGVLDVEDSEHARLKPCCEEETVRVGGQTKTSVVVGIAEFICLFKFFRIPESNREIVAECYHILGVTVENNLLNVFGVGSNDGSVVVAGEIKDRENSG